VVDNNTTGNASALNPSTMPEGNSVALPHAHTRITPSSSTLSPSMSPMAVPTIATPLTATVSESEKENHRIQGTEPGTRDDNAANIAGMAQTLDSIPAGSSLPLESISNNVLQSGQHHSLAKRVKGLAVVGTGLTDKCVKS
jgi:hypothetical protein